MVGSGASVRIGKPPPEPGVLLGAAPVGFGPPAGGVAVRVGVRVRVWVGASVAVAVGVRVGVAVGWAGIMVMVPGVGTTFINDEMFPVRLGIMA